MNIDNIKKENIDFIVYSEDYIMFNNKYATSTMMGDITIENKVSKHNLVDGYFMMKDGTPLINDKNTLFKLHSQNRALELMAKDLIKIYYGELFQVDYIITKYENQAREELRKEMYTNATNIK